jgi:hypothetical protein
MSKLAGRWIKVLLDDTTPTARDISGDVESVDIDDGYGELDVTGFGDGSENSIPGMPTFNVELTCHFNPAATTGVYTVVKGIVGAYSGHTLTVQQGQNAAPTTGDPEFEGEYWCSGMKFSSDPKGKTTLTVSLRVYGSTAPAWGTV